MELVRLFAFVKRSAVIGILALLSPSAYAAGCNRICNNCFEESGHKPICLYEVDPGMEVTEALTGAVPESSLASPAKVKSKLSGKSLFFYDVTPEMEAKIKAAIGQK